MTGYRSSAFRHNCSKSGCYTLGLPCWDELITCFPRGIKPMDIDGYVEINGHYLFLEQKGKGAPLYQPGQGDALRMLARLPEVTVVVFREAAEEGFRDVVVNDDGQRHAFTTVSDDQFYAWLRKWAIDADARAA